VPTSTDAEPELRKTSRKRRLAFRIAAVVIALAISLYACEFAVYVSGINNDFRSPSVIQISTRPGNPTELTSHGFIPFASIQHWYSTNPRRYFDQDNSIRHDFNSEGWRDFEHEVEKPDHVFRIVGAGDSFTFGQGVKHEDLFLTHLNSLEATASGMQIEVINTGQPGYNTVKEKELLETRGFDYSPDLVLLSFVPNDVETDIYTDRPKVEFFEEFTASYTQQDWLSEHSELWMLGRRKFLQYSTADSYLQKSIDSYLHEPEKWNRCREALTGIRDLCRQNDCKLAVAIFPFFVNLNGDYPFQPIHDHVRNFCVEAGIPVVDLRESFREFEGPELWVHPTDQHPNEQAHRIAAESIVNFLTENGLLP
jgi:hypothetical protein